MKSKTLFIYSMMITALAISALLSLSLGSADLSIGAIINGITGKAGFEYERAIMLYIRIPRLLAAITAGFGLSLSGVIIQSVMGNDLASPNTIGVSSGAGLMTVIFLSFCPALSHLLPIAAFAGAFASSLLIMLISRATGGGKATLILAGIALTSLLGAGISFVSSLDTDVLASYSAFSIGGFSGVTVKKLITPVVLIFACLLVSVSISGRMSALSLGDEAALGLGIKPGALRALSLALAAMSAAAVVSFAGLLGFVGLIVPHMVRKIVGQRLIKQLTLAPLLGATLVTLSDLLGRVIFAPSEISVGIIMAFIGSPFFFILLIKRRGHNA